MEMKWLSQIHGNWMIISGISAKQVETKISLNFPSPSIKVVNDQFATQKNSTGTMIYAASSKLLNVFGLSRFTTNPLYCRCMIVVKTRANKMPRDTYTV